MQFDFWIHTFVRIVPRPFEFHRTAPDSHHISFICFVLVPKMGSRYILCPSLPPLQRDEFLCRLQLAFWARLVEMEEHERGEVRLLRQGVCSLLSYCRAVDTPLTLTGWHHCLHGTKPSSPIAGRSPFENEGVSLSQLRWCLPRYGTFATHSSSHVSGRNARAKRTSRHVIFSGFLHTRTLPARCVVRAAECYESIETPQDRKSAYPERIETAQGQEFPCRENGVQVSSARYPL